MPGEVTVRIGNRASETGLTYEQSSRLRDVVNEVLILGVDAMEVTG